MKRAARGMCVNDTVDGNVLIGTHIHDVDGSM